MKATDEDRGKRLLRAMREARLDALVCTDASDVLLLTGFWPVMATSVTVLTGEGELRTLVPEDELELAEANSSLTLQTYKPGALDRLSDPEAALRPHLAALLAGLGLDKARIGIRTRLTERPSSYVVCADFHHTLATLLVDLLPGAELASGDDVLETQKAAKTPLELERMQRAADLVAPGFGAAEHAIRPGLREAEVAAALQHAFDVNPEAAGVQRSYGSFFCMSGPNAATADAAYARTRQRRLEPGDLVLIHANTCADGYWTDVTRTYTAGEPSPQQRAWRQAVDEARAAAFAAVKPGAAASEVDGAARAVLSAYGLGKAFTHGTGHGVGFAAANASGLPRIHPCSPDVLAEGMTFNVEPAVYFKGVGGIRHCDLVAVTSTGARNMTEF